MECDAAGDVEAPRLGPLGDAMLADAVRVLAAAFRDNPLNVAVIGGDPALRLRSNRVGMAQLIPQVQRHGLALAATQGAVARGALLAVPPLRYPLPPPPLRIQLRTAFAQGLGASRRWARVFEELDRVHPAEPHWYLATLGVEPPFQARGIGTALLARLLRRADEEGMPTYLETDRRANVSLYERNGFRVLREALVLDVPTWHMQRPARSA